MIKVDFVIPGRVLSANDMYRRSKNGIYLTQEAKDYKKIAVSFVRAAFKGQNHGGGILKFELEVNDNWYTQDGKVRHIDADNMIKLVQDAIFQVKEVGIDDSMIFDARVKKVQNKSELPHARIKITEMTAAGRKLHVN